MPCGGFGERVVNTMAESKNYIVQPQEGGNILISEDVIASIASLAVREVEGVYGLSATQTLDLTAILGKKNLSSGIRVDAGRTTSLTLPATLSSVGQPVMTVAKNVQEGIANAVESMAGVRRPTSMSTSAALPRRRRSRPEAMPLCSPRRRAAVLHFHFTYQGDMT